MKSFLNTIQSKLHSLDSSKLFQGSVILVILFSALTIGLKTHNIPDDFLFILGFVDIGITVFFAFEILSTKMNQ